MSTAIAERTTVKALVAMPGYRQRFDEVLGKDKAAAFLGSLTALTVDKYIAACEPKSVLAAAFVAATLDLPIQKNLGFAFVVPYNGIGQFQIGWKGIVQLALRSGQYRRLNAFKVNAEAYLGMDEFAEARIDHHKLDDMKPPVGYAVSWELVNGFRKTVYWTREKCLAHAERYSQARKKKKMDSPWFTHEDEMCLKTVLKNGLQNYGSMSVQMQRAFVEDQCVRMEIDGEPEHIDAETMEPEQGNGKSKADALAEQLGGASVTKDGGEAEEIALNAAEIGEALGMNAGVVKNDIAAATKDGKLRQLRDGWAAALKAKTAAKE